MVIVASFVLFTVVMPVAVILLAWVLGGRRDNG